MHNVVDVFRKQKKEERALRQNLSFLPSSPLIDSETAGPAHELSIQMRHADPAGKPQVGENDAKAVDVLCVEASDLVTESVQVFRETLCAGTAPGSHEDAVGSQRAVCDVEGVKLRQGLQGLTEHPPDEVLLSLLQGRKGTVRPASISPRSGARTPSSKQTPKDSESSVCTLLHPG